MIRIDGQPVTERDLGRSVYAVSRSLTLFGELSRVNSDFVFVLAFDGREHAFHPNEVHWGERPESQYKSYPRKK